MTPENSIEIARHDGPEFRSVRLGVEAGGAIVMDAQDMGPNVRKSFGDEDYEFGLSVPSTMLSRLAFELLKDRFTGDIEAVNHFRDWCKARGIEYRWQSW